MYLAKYFVSNYHVEKQVTFLMDHLEFILVPFVNPDGYVVGVAVARASHMTLYKWHYSLPLVLAVHMDHGQNVEEEQAPQAVTILCRWCRGGGYQQELP